MNRKLGLAVIGCGMAAKPHGLALQALSDVTDVQGVHARDRQRLQRFTTEFGFPVSENAEALAEDAVIEVVLILTLPNAREAYLYLFAAAGEHVPCEKPLERTVEAAERIVSICRDQAITTSRAAAAMRVMGAGC